MRSIFILIILFCVVPLGLFAAEPNTGTDALLGVWTGPATYAGDSAILTMRFTKEDNGEVVAVFDLLQTNIQNATIGKVTWEGNLYNVPPSSSELSAGLVFFGSWDHFKAIPELGFR